MREFTEKQKERLREFQTPRHFTFGEHKDVPFEEVPTRYLEWFISFTDHKDTPLYKTVANIYQNRMIGTAKRPKADYQE